MSRAIPLFLLVLALNVVRAQTPEAVAAYQEKNFPRDEDGCARLTAPAGPSRSEPVDYCVQLHSVKTVDDNRQYALFLASPKTEDSVAVGLVRWVRFDRAGRPEQEKDYYANGWGDRVPSDWRWLELGPGIWAANDQVAYLRNDDRHEEEIFLYDRDGSTGLLSLPSAFDNTERLGDCHPENGDIATDCRARHRSLRATLKVRPDLIEGAEQLYPLEMKVSGYIGLDGDGKRFEEESYLWRFSPASHRYERPAGYPLDGEQ